MVSEKGLGIGFGKFGIGKKVSVSVSVKILVSSFSARGLRKPVFPDVCTPVLQERREGSEGGAATVLKIFQSIDFVSSS